MDSNLISWLGVFALLSLGLKVTLLALVNTRRLRSVHYFLLLIFLAAQNGAEALGYAALLHYPELGGRAVDVYMVALYFIAASIFCIALGRWMVRPGMIGFVYLVAAGISAMHLSGLLVEGYRFQGYALVRIRGDFFWIADAFLLISACVGATVPFLIKSKRVSDYAVSGFSVTLLSVVLLQLFDIDATTAVIQPVFAIALSISLLIEAKSKRMLRLQGVIYRTCAGVRTINSKLPLAEKLKILEEQQIVAALMVAENVQCRAANDLGISGSAISKKLSRREK